MEADRIEAITALLVQAGQAHAAFEATELNGVYDQEWPRWYAVYAVDHGLDTMLGHAVTLDGVAEYLAATYLDFQQIGPEPVEPWTAYTARRIAAEL